MSKMEQCRRGKAISETTIREFSIEMWGGGMGKIGGGSLKDQGINTIFSICRYVNPPLIYSLKIMWLLYVLLTVKSHFN